MITNAPSSPFVVVAGPTGSGKSALALHLAKRFGGAIINCDSLQVFRFFNIGTAKLSLKERQEIPHYLIDACNPNEVFTAGDYSRLSRLYLSQIRDAGRLPIVAGGTGFYLRALIQGLAPGPTRDNTLRERLMAREARRNGSLHRLLRRLDRETGDRIHPNDTPKVIRALEICLRAKRPATEVFAEGRDPLAGFRHLLFALFPDRDALYRRLDERVEAMFAAGLVEEVKTILNRGFEASAKPFESIGYKQALAVAQGESSLRDAIFYTKRDTRRYAKRQMTWFRQEPGAVPIRGFGDDEEVEKEVSKRVQAFLELT